MLARNVIFILSAAHSGSTWVGYVLGSHPASAFLGEYYRAWDKEASVPCTLCAAKGLDQCEVLYGAENVPGDLAFAWAFERTERQVLIDNSKQLAWTERFIADGRGYEVRLIHVIKDPRNWLLSTRRRIPSHCDELIGAWHDTNTQIRAFTKRVDCASLTVFYDELAADQASGFRRLFEFCGMRFDIASLSYWDFRHHGFAANGASSAILADKRLGDPPVHFATGDDAFYARHTRTMFVDCRWKKDLGDEDIYRISRDPRVTDLLAELGRHLTPDGLKATGLVAGIRMLSARIWRRT